jgi:phosphate transport system protein
MVVRGAASRNTHAQARRAGVGGGKEVPAMSIAITEHTLKAFDADLQELTRMVAEMGGLAERQIIEAVEALKTGDRDRGQRVAGADAELDIRQREIEHKAIATIATRQPMAVDLREIVGVLRIANDLERIGDLAKNTAKRVIALNGEHMPRRVLRGVLHMTDLALGLLRDVLDSYAERDSRKAVEVWRRDEEIDSMYTSLFRELLTYMMEDPGTLAFGVHLLFCAKNIERIGDHATNIAESVYFIIEGLSFSDERPKADSTSMMTVDYNGRH